MFASRNVYSAAPAHDHSAPHLAAQVNVVMHDGVTGFPAGAPISKASCDDLRARSKALWIAATLVVPVIGPIGYFIARPGAARAAEREALQAPPSGASR